MKKIQKIFIIILSMMGCESVVDVDLPKAETQIVVNSFFSPDSIFKVHLSKSRDILSPDVYDENWNSNFEIIENAEIQLLNNGEFINTLQYSNNGYYIAHDFTPSSDEMYNIVVNVENYGAVTAEGEIPDLVEIKNVTQNIIPHDEYWNEREIEIEFEDFTNRKNYYMLSLNSKESYDNIFYSYNIYFTSNDLALGESNIIDDTEYSFNGNIAIFGDEVFDGKNYKLKIKTDGYETGVIEIRLASISEDMYKYLKSLEQQNLIGDNPFAEPVFVYSNIENGLGIFAGYNISVFTITAN